MVMNEEFKRRLLRRLKMMIYENNVVNNLDRTAMTLEDMKIDELIRIASLVPELVRACWKVWELLCDDCVERIGYCPGHCEEVITLSGAIRKAEG
jgi:hypothetical protein